jgi:spermidine synthase
MNYERIYYAIIEKAKSEKRSKKTAYYESHHIVPASFGGSNRVENKVLLTPREHFICHYLLMKIPRNEHWKPHRLTVMSL